VLYYAFAVFLRPMRDALDATTAEVTGAFSLATLISAVAGVWVGRHLDRHSPRPMMTAGSVFATACLVAWSQVHGLAALYLVWALIGLAMACVLYEPAFVVLAKHFPEPEQRRRAMTAMTLVAATSSFIFLPMSEALVNAHGWREALLILAGVLAAATIPLHGLVLRAAPVASHARGMPVDARKVLRSKSFWVISAAFALGSLAAFGVIVLGIDLLVERGCSTSFAALAIGLVGISQIPGRLLFAPLSARLPAYVVMALVFALMAAGIALFIAADGRVGILAGLVALGMSNGMSILSRATVLADRYGQAIYGAVAGVAAATTTAARALGPVAAAAFAGLVGNTTMVWTLSGLALLAATLVVLDRGDASFEFGRQGSHAEREVECRL
jgi:predicted MFS family arabinose efflux permease